MNRQDLLSRLKELHEAAVGGEGWRERDFTNVVRHHSETYRLVNVLVRLAPKELLLQVLATVSEEEEEQREAEQSEGFEQRLAALEKLDLKERLREFDERVERLGEYFGDHDHRLRLLEGRPA